MKSSDFFVLAISPQILAALSKMGYRLDVLIK